MHALSTQVLPAPSPTVVDVKTCNTCGGDLPRVAPPLHVAGGRQTIIEWELCIPCRRTARRIVEGSDAR